MKKYTAKEIKEIRAKLSLTQKELAEQLGVSKRSVEAWEIGKRNPNGSACILLEQLNE